MKLYRFINNEKYAGAVKVAALAILTITVSLAFSACGSGAEPVIRPAEEQQAETKEKGSTDAADNSDAPDSPDNDNSGQDPGNDAADSTSGSSISAAGDSAPAASAADSMLSADTENVSAQERIYVFVCGCVRTEGVYSLPAGSRAYEAVEAAGGMTQEAAADYVNQAMVLSDSQKLYIPSSEEVAAGYSDPEASASGIAGSSNAAGSTASGDVYGGITQVSANAKVNINTADEALLETIPGIGATRAAAIIAYRQESGAFETPEDIMKVSGIKQGTYDRIKDYICTGAD